MPPGRDAISYVATQFLIRPRTALSWVTRGRPSFGPDEPIEVVGAVRPDQRPGRIERNFDLPGQDHHPVLMPYSHFFRTVPHAIYHIQSTARTYERSKNTYELNLPIPHSAPRKHPMHQRPLSVRLGRSSRYGRKGFRLTRASMARCAAGSIRENRTP